jgi:hypothetical protein
MAKLHVLFIANLVILYKLPDLILKPNGSKIKGQWIQNQRTGREAARVPHGGGELRFVDVLRLNRDSPLNQQGALLVQYLSLLGSTLLSYSISFVGIGNGKRAVPLMLSTLCALLLLLSGIHAL